MRIAAPIVLCLASAVAIASDAAPAPDARDATDGTLSYPTLGFSIKPPAFAGSASGQVAMLFVPPTGGFAGNVNVQVQDYAGTLAEYETLSKQQAAGMNFEVTSSKIENDVLRMEWAGPMQGRSLRWISRARKRGGHVYLTTATFAADAPAEQVAALRASVDSFAFTDGER